jgi:DNA-directed RNA polymerase specialized sigma24 family protein
MRALADDARSPLLDANRSDQPSHGHRESGPDPKSFDAFVVRSRHDLFRALAAHFHYETATEALADAYAYAWKYWDTVGPLENPVGYVYRVAERLGMRAEIRNRKVAPVEVLGEQSESVTTGLHPRVCANTASPWLETYESDSGVIELLRQLPSRQRACVLLIHAYGWTYKQAAHTLDLSITTVTNEATRGMTRLRMNQ